MVPFVIAVLSLSVSAFGFLYLLRYVKRQTSAARLLADYREEVDSMVAEIDNITHRDEMLVEARIKELRKLLEDTDRRIAVYVKEVQRSRAGEAMYASLGRGIRAALESKPPQQSQPLLFNGEPADDGKAASGDGKKQKGKGRAVKTGEAEGLNAEEEADEQVLAMPPAQSKIKVRIAEMSARDVPRHEIASKLGISIAEVDLALNLLNRG